MPYVSAEKDPIQLLKKIVSKDRDAFSALYDRCAPQVFGFILRIVGNRSDAQEILQDVFYYVWEKAANYDAERGAPLAWLVTIARSRSIDCLRSRQRKPGEWSSIDDLADSAMYAENTTEASILSRSLRETLEAKIQDVSVIQKEALELAYFEGLTQSEIAIKLGIPLGTVKTRLRDGLKKLREVYDPTH